MKNKLTILKSTFVLLAVFCMTIRITIAAPSIREYYELKIYHISGKAQEDRVDAFLKDVYLPALHRAGVLKVGVFKPVETDTVNVGKLVYLLIPFKTIEEYSGLQDILLKDKKYMEAGKSFIDAPFDNPPYQRHESVLLLAFMDMPQSAVPKYLNPAGERIYELRDYESATEAKGTKKIVMFNDGGEIKLFQKLGFNPVFFAQVIAGSHKPDLMYMITFQNMNSHDEHWKTFLDSQEWKTLSGMDEYKNTVSKHTPYLLHPTAYSEF